MFHNCYSLYLPSSQDCCSYALLASLKVGLIHSSYDRDRRHCKDSFQSRHVSKVECWRLHSSHIVLSWSWMVMKRLMMMRWRMVLVTLKLWRMEVMMTQDCIHHNHPKHYKFDNTDCTCLTYWIYLMMIKMVMMMGRSLLNVFTLR